MLDLSINTIVKMCKYFAVVYCFHTLHMFSLYRNDPKFSDRYAWANSADPDQTAPRSDQGLHCLPFRLHRLDSLHCSRAT